MLTIYKKVIRNNVILIGSCAALFFVENQAWSLLLRLFIAATALLTIEKFNDIDGYCKLVYKKMGEPHFIPSELCKKGWQDGIYIIPSALAAGSGVILSPAPLFGGFGAADYLCWGLGVLVTANITGDKLVIKSYEEMTKSDSDMLCRKYKINPQKTTDK